MKILAAVVCNNGLGHLKRVLHVVNRLYQRHPVKTQTYIFVDLKKMKRFPGLARTSFREKKKVRFFDIRADGPDYEQEFISKYKDILKGADYVWSDNLVFPLKYRREVFLTGSFLWQEIYPDQEEARREKDLLLKHRPVMIANKYFATPGVKSLTNYYGVGIYEYFASQAPKKFPPGILLSCGQSRTARLSFEKHIPCLKEAIANIPPDVEVFMEPDFHFHFHKIKNVKKADFTEKMYARISAAAIRPGIGTVCDVLLKGGRIYAFFENANFEVRHNAEVLEKLLVGENCQYAETAIVRAAEYLYDKKRQKRHVQELKKIDFDGLAETVKIIQEIVN